MTENNITIPDRKKKDTFCFQRIMYMAVRILHTENKVKINEACWSNYNK